MIKYNYFKMVKKKLSPIKEAKEIVQEFLIKNDSYIPKESINIMTHWEDIIGERIAQNSKIVDIKGNEIVIITNHPMFLQYIHMNKSQIIKKINYSYPELGISKIKASLGTL